MSRDITERATPQRVTEWCFDLLHKHLAERCLCISGDPCKGAEIVGWLRGEYVRDFQRAEGMGE